MLLILSFILLTSCGLRSDEELYRNPFKGEWNLEAVKCYVPDIRGRLAEDYMIGDTDRIEINFSSKSFTYSVDGNSGPGCNLSTLGTYLIDFENTVTGLINFGNITGESTGNCKIEAIDSLGSNVSFDIDIGFLSLRDEISKLYWNKDNGEMLIQSNSGFKGSSNTDGDFCASNCTCYNLYVPN